MNSNTLFLILAVILASGEASARRHHYYHHRYQHQHYDYEHIPLFDPSFCSTVLEAFSHYDIKDLDRFVDSIPSRRRIEAGKCLGKDNGGR